MNCIVLFYVLPPLSISLSISLLYSLSVSHLGDSSVHAASNLSRYQSGCSVYALCAALLSSPLFSALYCTALHCTSLLSSPLISISPRSVSLFSLPLPASLSHALISFVHCCTLLHCLGFLAPELSTL